MFRGREVTHPERGTALLDRLAGELAEIAVIEQTPLQDGRNMTMLLAPSKAVLANEKGKGPVEEAVADEQSSPNGAPSTAKAAAPAAAEVEPSAVPDGVSAAGAGDEAA
jgi:translation initiation factor IF-3